MYNRIQGHVYENLIYSAYYAPRGRQRLYMLGNELSQRYLNPNDHLIGIIGAEGAGKSTLIQALFPGLQLTNDDEGVNHARSLIYEYNHEDFYSGHTFHLDVRYELAFKQLYEIAEAVNYVVSNGRRVVVEHFDLIYEKLGYNAQVIFGIGEEVIVARPSVFGPFPGKIKSIVDKTIKFRLMAHSAEDITSYILEKDYGFTRRMLHSDVKHGFVMNFQEKPDFKINELEEKVLKVIKNDLPIVPDGTNKITIGNMGIYCTGVRTHVNSSGKIKDFRLCKEFLYNPISKEYLLVGMVGNKEIAGFEEMTDMMEVLD